MSEVPLAAGAPSGQRPAEAAQLPSWIMATYRAQLELQGIELLADKIAWVKWQRHANRVLADCVVLLGVEPEAEEEADLSVASVAAVDGKPFTGLSNPVDLFLAISTFVEVASDALVTFLIEQHDLSSVPVVLQVLIGGALAAVNVAATWYDTLLNQDQRLESGERRRLARDLHDWVGSGISLAVRQLELYETYRASGRARQARGQIPRAQATLEDLLARTSALVKQLASETPSVHLALGLKEFAREMNMPGVSVQVLIRGDEAVLPASYREALFLVLREALRNALTHAHARNILVETEIQEHDVWAAVDDDGVGLQLADQPGPAAALSSGGHGLAAMRERIKILGGGLLLVSKPAQGLRVEIHLPLPQGR